MMRLLTKMKCRKAVKLSDSRNMMRVLTIRELVYKKVLSFAL